MLGNSTVSAQLPASDFGRAKKYYQETLGLTLAEEMEAGARFEAGSGTSLWVYPSEFAGTNKATSASFAVDNIEKSVDILSERGVKFEQYDMPGLKTDARGIAEAPGWKGAWFKDSEGNILALGQMGS